MSTVLTFFNTQFFYRHLLPADNNADYFYTLVGKRFCLEENLKLHLEIINKNWRICPAQDYQLCVRKEEGWQEADEACPLTDGQEFEIVTSDGERIGVRVQEDYYLHPYEKYQIGQSREVRIGTDDGCDVRIAPEDGSVRRVVLHRTGDQAFLENLSEDGVYVNAMAVRGRATLAYADTIDIPPMRMVYLGDVLAVDKDALASTRLERFSQAPAGAKEYGISVENALYRRSPRTLEALDTGLIDIEAPPDPYELKKLSFGQMVGNSVLMMIPMLLGSLLMIIASRQQSGMTSLFMYSGLVMAVSSMLVGIIWAVISARGAVADQKASENHRFEAYSAYLIGKSDEIRNHYNTNKERLQRLYPSAGVCLGYNRSGTQLWNRNSSQEDFLKVRVGTGNIPFQMEIHIPQEHFSMTDDSLRTKPEWIRENYRTLYDVPVLLDLKAHPLTGYVGGEDKFGSLALMRVTALQLAATHCYTDLKMVFLYDSLVESREYDFAKWLPHVWSENRKIRYTAGSASEISDVCYELTKIFHERMENQKEYVQKGELPLPHYVLFLSDPRLIEGERISSYVYREGEKVGLSTVILADYRENLPNECDYFLYANDRFEGIESTGVRQELKFDTLTESDLAGFARRISGVRVKENATGGELPSSVTFMEMYGVSSVEELDVKNRWLKNRTYDNVRGLLGVKGADELLYLDLHEKYHGPHGLVAGTTGSGKSETLQTFLLSLAVEYSPEDVSYFVIDYKGGGMANLFDGLPHLTGSISNLSGAQINRALVSIKSENRRRQMMFNAAHVNNINRYTHLYKEGQVSEPIPHLLIVIDEFAELKKEEPDFMRELISVAQVGRSLGVHLILATQRPSGTVDDNIWSNSNFRLCLRVQTKEDSVDMLGNPDAAFITQAGRGYLQVGNHELYEMFQSGFSGAPYEPEKGSDSEATSLLTLTGRTEFKYEGSDKSSEKQSRELSQLDAVKDYLAEIAQAEGYTKGHQLWMPLLRNPIYLEEFEQYTSRCAGEDGWKEDASIRDHWDLSVVIGQTDDPQNQAQDPLYFSLAKGGNHAVTGSVVSGKSALLQTILYALVTTYSPQYLNLYVIDYSSRLLSAFEDLPHTGGVMFEGDEEKTARFFNMIENLLEERKKKYRGGNYAQYVKAHGVEDPAIVFAVDNFAAFNEKTGEKYLPRMIALSKEGVSNGIFLLLSSGGFGMNEIPNRLAENMGTVLTLALPDKFAYADVLRVTRVNTLPDTTFRGRGLCRVGDEILVYQAALALPADDDFQRMEGIRRRCAQLCRLWDGPKARRVPEIPENPTREVFLALPQVQEAIQEERYLPIGYRQDNAEVYSFDFYSIYCCLIAGQRRSGKSSLLRLMIQEALKKEHDGVTLIDGGGKLKDLYGMEGLRVITDREALYEYCFHDLTPIFRERNQKKHALLDQGLEDAEYYAGMAAYRPVYIFITDLTAYMKDVYADEHDMRGFMETLFKKGEDHKITFIAALGLENRAEAAGYEAFNDFTQYRTGIHMGGNLSQDPYLSFESVGFREQSKPEAPGIATIPEMGAVNHALKLVIPYAPKHRRSGLQAEEGEG